MKGFFIVLAVGLIAGAGFFLYQDYRQTQVASESPTAPDSIGTVQALDNGVQKKSSAEDQWVNLEIKGPILSRDVVRTSAQSSAIVRINDGTLVQISQNSEVTFSREGSVFAVNLTGGEISSDVATTGAIINTRGAMMGGAGLHYKVVTDPDGKSQVNISKGTGSVTDKYKKVVSFSEADTVFLTDGVYVQTTKATATNAVVPVPLKSATPAPAPTAHKPVVVAARPPQKKTTPRPTPLASATPRPSPTATATPEPDSSGRTFTFIFPKDQSELSRNFSDEKIEPIIFKWKVNKPLPGSLTMSLSTDPEFTDPMTFKDVKNGNQKVTLKKEGIYYWNLSSQGEDGALEISPVATFNLKSLAGMGSPVPVNPIDRQQIESDTAKAITFKWSAPQGAQEYHFVLKRVDAQTKEQFIVTDTVVNQPTFTSDPLDASTYLWNVTAKDNSNHEKSFKREMTFTLAAPFQMDAPKLKDPVVK